MFNPFDKSIDGLQTLFTSIGMAANKEFQIEGKAPIDTAYGLYDELRTPGTLSATEAFARMRASGGNVLQMIDTAMEVNANLNYVFEAIDRRYDLNHT